MARFSGSSGSGIPANISESELLTLDGVVSAIQTQIDGKQAVVANVSNTEIGYLDGVTSAIQTQIDTKLATATAASTYQAINANVSTTELGYLDGVTSAIQTQMDAKAPSSTAATLTGTQTLTNKTIDTASNTITGAVTLTGTQTLTNKTLTNPVISSVINNTLTTTTGDIIYASAANTPARLASGTSGYVLTSGGASTAPSWAAPASGGNSNIVQTLVTAGSTLATTAATFADIPSLTATITPTTDSKKVLVTLSISFVNGTDGTNSAPNPLFRLMRGSTAIVLGDTNGSNTRATFGLAAGAFGFFAVDIMEGNWLGSWMYAPGYAGTVTINYSYLDSPATTSATTYKVQYTDAYLALTSYFNRPNSTATNSYLSRTTSNIILQEV